MRNRWIRCLAGTAVLTALASPGGAQQPTPPAAQPEVGPKVGDVAPDFEFAGITRYGKLAQKQKLSDLRGKVVVLAFFPKARSRG